MRWLNRIAVRLRSLFRRSHVEAALDRELRFHLEQQINENIAAGMPPDQARSVASQSFGGFLLTKDQCREALALRLIDELRQNVHYAARTLTANPGFAIVAMLSLAIGVGANAAIFSLADALLLRPLPVA